MHRQLQRHFDSPKSTERSRIRAKHELTIVDVDRSETCEDCDQKHEFNDTESVDSKDPFKSEHKYTASL